MQSAYYLLLLHDSLCSFYTHLFLVAHSTQLSLSDQSKKNIALQQPPKSVGCQKFDLEAHYNIRSNRQNDTTFLYILVLFDINICVGVVMFNYMVAL